MEGSEPRVLTGVNLRVGRSRWVPLLERCLSDSEGTLPRCEDQFPPFLGVLSLAQDAVSSRTSNLTTKGSETGGERAAYYAKAEGREKDRHSP